MMLTWLGLLGGAAAWTAQLVLSYLVVGLACGPETPLGGGLSALGGATVVLHAVSGLAAAAASASAAAAVIAWRRPAGGGDGSLALVAVALDLLFLLVILVGASAALVLPTCAG